jgi:hypothetical protein
MDKRKSRSSVIPFQQFMHERKERNEAIRREWDEIFLMTYDSLLEVLEDMNIKEDAERKQQQEKEKRNGIPTKSF